MAMKREISDIIKALEQTGPVPIRGSVVEESEEAVKVRTGGSTFEIPRKSIVSARQTTDCAGSSLSELGIASNATVIQRVPLGGGPVAGGSIMSEPICYCACACNCACNCACDCACDCSSMPLGPALRQQRFRRRVTEEI